MGQDVNRIPSEYKRVMAMTMVYAESLSKIDAKLLKTGQDPTRLFSRRTVLNFFEKRDDFYTF